MMYLSRLKIAASLIVASGLAVAASALGHRGGFRRRAASASDSIRAAAPRPRFRAASLKAAIHRVLVPKVLQDRSRAATSDDGSTRKRMTLQEAIDRYLRECAGQSVRYEITAADSERLTSLLRLDLSASIFAGIGALRDVLERAAIRPANRRPRSRPRLQKLTVTIKCYSKRPVLADFSTPSIRT